MSADDQDQAGGGATASPPPLAPLPSHLFKRFKTFIIENAWTTLTCSTEERMTGRDDHPSPFGNRFRRRRRHQRVAENAKPSWWSKPGRAADSSSDERSAPRDKEAGISVTQDGRCRNSPFPRPSQHMPQHCWCCGNRRYWAAATHRRTPPLKREPAARAIASWLGRTRRCPVQAPGSSGDEQDAIAELAAKPTAKLQGNATEHQTKPALARLTAKPIQAFDDGNEETGQTNAKSGHGLRHAAAR